MTPYTSISISHTAPPVKGRRFSLSKSIFPRLSRKVQMLGSAATTSLCGCRSGADDADVPLSTACSAARKWTALQLY